MINEDTEHVDITNSHLKLSLQSLWIHFLVWQYSVRQQTWTKHTPFSKLLLFIHGRKFEIHEQPATQHLHYEGRHFLKSNVRLLWFTPGSGSKFCIRLRSWFTSTNDTVCGMNLYSKSVIWLAGASTCRWRWFTEINGGWWKPSLMSVISVMPCSCNAALPICAMRSTRLTCLLSSDKQLCMCFRGITR